MPCDAKLPGCTEHGTIAGVVDGTYAFCQGIGHVDCRGGVYDASLNTFGVAFIANGKAWTRALCEADSDGDGYTNGEELGDPCCMWTFEGASVGGSEGSALGEWPRSHPGYAQSVPLGLDVPNPQGSSVRERWQCAGDASGVMEQASVADVYFNPTETRKTFRVDMPNVTVPCDVRTTYLDVSVNLPEEMAEECMQQGKRCILVAAEAIVDSPRLHHFVVTSCTSRVPDELHGKAVVNEYVRKSVLKAEGKLDDDSEDEREGGDVVDDIIDKNATQMIDLKRMCNGYIGAWAPGSDPFVKSRRDNGLPIGGVASPLVAISIDAHYDNFDMKCGTTDSSAVVLHYTVESQDEEQAAAGDDSGTSLRPLVESDLSFLRVSVNSEMEIPPSVSRAFVSSLCQVRANFASDDPEDHAIELESSWFHGHLVANGMHSRLYRRRDNNTAKEYTNVDELMADHELVTPIMDLPAWHFDDQFKADLARDAKLRYGNLVGMTPKTRAALDLAARDQTRLQPLPSDRPRLLLRDGDIIHSVCMFNTTKREEATTFGVQTTDEMCWNGATFVTADGSRARCAPLQMFVGILDDSEVASAKDTVDGIWTRADAATALGLYRSDAPDHYREPLIGRNRASDCTADDMKSLMMASFSDTKSDVDLSSQCKSCLRELGMYFRQSGVPPKFMSCFDVNLNIPPELKRKASERLLSLARSLV